METDEEESVMLAKARKWGNSIAMGIPKPIADDAGIHEDDQPDIEVVEGPAVLTPQRPPRYRLEDLLHGVTEANLHSEEDFGPSVGKEAL